MRLSSDALCHIAYLPYTQCVVRFYHIAAAEQPLPAGAAGASPLLNVMSVTGLSSSTAWERDVPASRSMEPPQVQGGTHRTSTHLLNWLTYCELVVAPGE